MPTASAPPRSGSIPASGQLCWDLYARQIDAATAAHIYRGAAGIVGPPVITLTTPGADGHSQGCMPIDEAMFARAGDARATNIM